MQLEVIETDERPCYMQQLLVDFKIYNPSVRPMTTADEGFIRDTLEACLCYQCGIQLLSRADEGVTVDKEKAETNQLEESHDGGL